jgi:hypothetical protein
MDRLNSGSPTRRAKWRIIALEVVGGLALSCAGVVWALQEISGSSGVIAVGADEIAVVFDHRTGASRVVMTPGNLVFTPFLQGVEVLSRKPAQLKMEGASDADSQHVSRLLLRANDGSRFGLESFNVQYALIPDRARDVLEDSHDNSRAKARLVEAWVRSVLRDEFGRAPAEEVSSQETLRAASEACKATLNEQLEPHGIEILELSTIRPIFDRDYEVAVERRQVAMQEIERLKRKLVQLDAEFAERLARKRKEKSVELKVLEGEVAQYLDSGERDAVNRRHAAVLYAADREAQGMLTRLELMSAAATNTEQYRAEADGLKETILALAERGDVVVREALIEKLAGIQFEFVPYSIDSSPAGMQMVQPALASLASKGH